MALKTLYSRSLESSEWSRMQKWLIDHDDKIGLKDTSWILDANDLCFCTCITVEDDSTANSFILSWC